MDPVRLPRPPTPSTPPDDESIAHDLPHVGALQITGGDMIIDDYTPIDEKQQDVAIINTPTESPDGSEGEPVADDYEAIKARLMPPIPDLEIESEAISTWEIEQYRTLSKREQGPVFQCGESPWRILLFPFGNNVDHASFYLEHGYGEKTPEDWYACVQFVLVLWNKNDPSIYTSHAANHRFNAEEGDWGFTRFAEIRKMFAAGWEGRSRPMVEDDAVNVTAYVRIYKDPTGVLWHNFQNYDSKKQTGMVGLKNQGATCYLNSLLQSLFFTNAFRKAVYQIPTEDEADRGNSARALQRLFYNLQSSDYAVSTQELTQSFGWETKHIFEQQDVQELSRILMENLETKMKGTEAENSLAKMFVGKMKTYISCVNVDYTSSRIEEFWDIQLNVSGNKSLDDSFRDYIQVETMDGENKYFAEGYGLQDAKKGVIFESFPSILHLQLKRFEYDMNRDAMMKVNDRYEFPEFFDASPYLSEEADKSESYVYQLHGVLVHSGDFNAGHYYAFLRPNKDDHFFKFDDDRVTRATNREAMEENYGGDYTNLMNGNTGIRNPYTRTLSTKRSMSAYMLVYIRQSRVDEIMLQDAEAATPPHIAKQLHEERALLERKRKEREEQHLYLSCSVMMEEQFRSYQGFDLALWDADPALPTTPQYYRTLRASTIGEFAESIAKEHGVSADFVRLWVMVNRQNKTIRPDQPLVDLNMTVEEAYTKFGSRDKYFRLWAEIAEADSDGKPDLPLEHVNASPNNQHILIFLKHYDVDAQTLMGVGHVYAAKHSKISDLVPLINHKMGWPSHNNTSIVMFEEIKHTMIEPLKSKSTLQQAEIQDGDIVCFQRSVGESEARVIAEKGGCASARDFYDYLLNRTIITFLPRVGLKAPEDQFQLALSKRMTYDQFSTKVGEHLGVDPTHIRFVTVNAATGRPKSVVKRVMSNNLNSILNPQYSSYNINQRNDSLFYEVLDMSLTELETRKSLRLAWVTEGLTKEEHYELLVSKSGNIGDLIGELKKKANLDDDTASKVRVICANNGKIFKEPNNDYPVTSIVDYYILYAERVPDEELNMTEDERLLQAFHCEKDVQKWHGIPFKFVIKPGETFKDSKIRLSKRTGIKGKPFENIKFAIVAGKAYSRPSPLADEDVLYDLANADDYLVLDHVNKARSYAGKGDSIFIR
ncbi:hypothetical protein MMC25_004196 [Agyrium rufum]|nr:hypothetical protein [Agyrium rufum]